MRQAIATVNAADIELPKDVVVKCEQRIFGRPAGDSAEALPEGFRRADAEIGRQRPRRTTRLAPGIFRRTSINHRSNRKDGHGAARTEKYSTPVQRHHALNESPGT